MSSSTDHSDIAVNITVQDDKTTEDGDNYARSATGCLFDEPPKEGHLEKEEASQVEGVIAVKTSHFGKEDNSVAVASKTIVQEVDEVVIDDVQEDEKTPDIQEDNDFFEDDEDDDEDDDEEMDDDDDDDDEEDEDESHARLSVKRRSSKWILSPSSPEQTQNKKNLPPHVLQKINNIIKSFPRIPKTIPHKEEPKPRKTRAIGSGGALDWASNLWK